MPATPDPRPSLIPPGAPVLPVTCDVRRAPHCPCLGGTWTLGWGGASSAWPDPGLSSCLLSHAVEVDPALEPESAEYLLALERATAALEQHVNLCKAHVMMVTCFDIAVTTPAATPGPQEVDV